MSSWQRWWNLRTLSWWGGRPRRDRRVIRRWGETLHSTYWKSSKTSCSTWYTPISVASWGTIWSRSPWSKTSTLMGFPPLFDRCPNGSIHFCLPSQEKWSKQGISLSWAQCNWDALVSLIALGSGSWPTGRNLLGSIPSLLLRLTVCSIRCSMVGRSCGGRTALWGSCR